MPIAMPIIPPATVRMIASERNWVIITFFLAPRALRSPISLVLSVTVTSMIFIMPIPPTNNEIAAMPLRSVVNVPVTADAVFKISFWEKMIKSA